MIVYVLFHETNSGHSEESDGYVEGVYLTEALAEQAKLAAIRTAIADGQDVYWDPDNEREGPADWTDDWHVAAHQVRDVAPELPPPTPDPEATDTCHTCGDVYTLVESDAEDTTRYCGQKCERAGRRAEQANR